MQKKKEIILNYYEEKVTNNVCTLGENQEKLNS